MSDVTARKLLREVYWQGSRIIVVGLFCIALILAAPALLPMFLVMKITDHLDHYMLEKTNGVEKT